MEEIKVFNTSIKGASHITSGKPCQDYSMSFNENGVQILVVCDGHGGESYVRSEVGAKLAAEITTEILLGFSRTMEVNPFEDCSFSITAKPQKSPFLDSDRNRIRYDEMNENQQRCARQAKAYTEDSSKHKDKQKIINELLTRIYSKWIDAITLDSMQKPFSKEERVKLNGKSTEIAYGCTLLAYMQTDSYWISFQIGDGRILFCNKNLSWSTPIQEDCNCFLNYTTSLCDSHPLDEFRYAFSGEGIFPFAVFLCSDGIEGSLRTDANIQDFYEQIIGICADGDDIHKELNDYLPELSKNGNKDDLSISGAIYLNKVPSHMLSIRLNNQQKKRAIHNEESSKKTEINKLSSRIDMLQIKLMKYNEDRISLKNSLESLRRSIQKKEEDLTDNENHISNIQNEIQELENELQIKNKQLNDWKFTIKNDLAFLDEELDEEKTDQGSKSLLDCIKNIL